MGIFSDKTIYVSSVVYNLAGDEDQREDYLETAVVSNMISETDFSMSETIKDSYLNGPGIRLRNYSKWAERTGYNDVVGVNTATIDFGNSIDNGVLAGQIPHAANEAVLLQKSQIGWADYTNWAEQYIQQNYPALYDTNWAADYNEGTNEITIHFEDLSTTSFTPAGYDKTARYLYAEYMLSYDAVVGELITGSTVTLGSGDPWPSTDGWTLQSDTSGGGEIHQVWTKTVTDGIIDDEITTTQYWMYFDQVPGIPSPTRTHRTDHQTTTQKVWSQLQIFIYQQGSGNATLDAMFAVPDDTTRFLPFIPIRIDNNFLSTTDPATYDWARRAFKKATGTGKLNKTQANIEDNPSLGDIDYAYVVFGVSLNVKEVACRKYVYKFFQEFLQSPDTLPTHYETWKTQFFAANASVFAWNEWRQGWGPEGSAFGTPPPEILPMPELPVFNLRVASAGAPVMNYDMTVQWTAIEEEIGAGLQHPGAKVGDLWFVQGVTEEFNPLFINDGVMMAGSPILVETIVLYWQESDTQWRAMTVYGLKHINRVYGGKAVFISAKEALNDEDESGFIIPLHEDIFDSMSLIDSTQMATACAFLVFNCYQVVKSKWYQSTLFKVIIVIIVIIVAVYTGYVDFAALELTMIGSYFAAMGLSTAWVVLATLLTNALIAMIVMKILGAVATKLFGERLGAIIAAIATVVLMAYGGAVAEGGGWAEAWGNLSSAEGLMSMSYSVGNNYAGYLGTQAERMALEAQDLWKQLEDKTEEIDQLYAANIGYGMRVFDPMLLTDSANSTVIPESRTTFLSRTLMTGSDIAELTNSLLSNFTKITLTTDLPGAYP